MREKGRSRASDLREENEKKRAREAERGQRLGKKYVSSLFGCFLLQLEPDFWRFFSRPPVSSERAILRRIPRNLVIITDERPPSFESFDTIISLYPSSFGYRPNLVLHSSTNSAQQPPYFLQNDVVGWKCRCLVFAYTASQHLCASHRSCRTYQHPACALDQLDPAQRSAGRWRSGRQDLEHRRPD